MTLSGYSGICGLGPKEDSLIEAKATSNLPKGASTDTLLDRIFQLNLTSSNYMTIGLGRDKATGTSTIDSQLTVMEIVQGYENVTNGVKNPIANVRNGQEINQHWSTFIDGIIGRFNLFI
jgi:hypothetical protein